MTKRGKRQIIDLVKANREGYRACLLFIVQRIDAYKFTSNDETYSEFGEALRNAFMEGVEAYAYNSKLIEDKVILDGRIEVELGF